MVDTSEHESYTLTQYVERFLEPKKRSDVYPRFWVSKYFNESDKYQNRSILKNVDSYIKDNKIIDRTGILRAIADKSIIMSGYEDAYSYCRSEGILAIRARKDDFEAESIGLYNHLTEEEALALNTEFFIELESNCFGASAKLAENDDNMSTYCEFD